MSQALSHFTRIADLGVEGVAEVIEQALRNKQQDPGAILPGRVLGMVFFNPSLRTRASFETAMLRSGGHAFVLDVGAGVWKLEDRDGVVMDGDRAEHVKEAVPVLARYADALAVRTFARLQDGDEDERDPVMSLFRQYSTVPVVNMESAREHPNQGLADLLTVRETFGQTRGVKVVLTWAPHIKPLPLAVPQSFLLSAAACGCDITVTHPEGFDLHPAVQAQAAQLAAQSGASVRFCADQREAFEGAQVIYAKSWAPMSLMPDADAAAARIRSLNEWMITRRKMEAAGSDPIFLHCLPLRRNIVAEDAVLDHPSSRVVDEAENRFHVQRVVLHRLLGDR